MEKDKVDSEDDNIVFINNRCYVLDPENGIENPENVFLEFIRGDNVGIDIVPTNAHKYSKDENGINPHPFYKIYDILTDRIYIEYHVYSQVLYIDGIFMKDYGLKLTQKNWGFEFVICDLVKKYLGWNVRDIKF